MVIDIDSFLQNYENKDSNKENSKKKKIDLDFQKDVEDKIQELAKNANNEDFKALISIYGELKKFDEDLPSKLLGIKKTSGTALKSIGTKYSEEFLKNVKGNMMRLGDTIKNKVSEVDNLLSQNQVTQSIVAYNEAFSNFKIFPKEFTTEKIELEKLLREKEIAINQKLKVAKDVEVKKIREVLKQELSELKNGITNSDTDLVEKKVERINYLMDKVPKIFFVELADERIVVANVIIKAQEFLKSEYVKEFNEKQDIIYKLFDDFHRFYVNKDVNNSLGTYDEILIAFEKIPDVFIEKKIDIYNQIGTIFESINNLLMTSNINMFLESYNNSKVILEARDYIEHVKMTNRVDINTVKDIVSKLEKVPSSLRPQTIGIINELKIIVRNQRKDVEPQMITRVERGLKENKTTDMKTPLIKENNGPNVKGDVSKSIMEEVNRYYEALKKSDDRKEITNLYKKINFYLDMLHLNEHEKKKIQDKISNTLKLKNNS